ncbi:PREDICTED: zinc finger protein 28-like [Trachymyrmex septentrionalis]|uniref:zinc finger protein 28-like n=1 Tax=Trachymyrmex septentrionalis TaxID=34720 RepID=UPI00084EDAFB|nr:PREDICTED: zinc finger protein 28-like [Trachymyrmex septentrionalis]
MAQQNMYTNSAFKGLGCSQGMQKIRVRLPAEINSLFAAKKLCNNINIHTEVKPYKCETCDKTFQYKSQLREHARIHTHKKLYQCEFCEKAFKRKSYLNMHKLSQHCNGVCKNYKCIVCKKNFKTQQDLYYHVDTDHSDSTFRKYKCDQCPSTFIHLMYLKQHMKIHIGEKPYVCESHTNGITCMTSQEQTATDNK